MSCTKSAGHILLVIALAFAVPVCAQEKPDTFADFFTQASVKYIAARLVGGESLGHEARDSTDPNAHLPWAKANNIDTVQKDLIEKFELMTGIMSRRGRQALAGWYADICIEWSGYGVDFGSDSANDPRWSGHYNWAAGASTPLDIIRNQIDNRIVRIFDSYRTKEQVLSGMKGIALAGGITFEKVQADFRTLSARIDSSNLGLKAELSSKRDQQALQVTEPADIPAQTAYEPSSPIKIKEFDPISLSNGYKTIGPDAPLTLSPGDIVRINGSNFGYTPGRAFIKLSKPVNGFSNIDLTSEFQKDATIWTNSRIYMAVPEMGSFLEEVEGTLRIVRNGEDEVRAFSMRITFAPKLEYYQVSGSKFFLPGIGTFIKGGHEYFAIDGINQAIDVQDKYLFVMHIPDGDEEVVQRSRDFFKHGQYLPPHLKLAKVVICHIDPVGNWIDKLKSAEEEAFSNLLEAGFRGLAQNPGDPIFFRTDYPTAGHYSVRPYFETSKHGYRLLSVGWENTNEGDSAFEGKALTYVVTFYLIGPAGYPPPTVPTDKRSPF